MNWAFLALLDKNYINHFELALDSLKQYNYSANQFQLGCTDIESTQYASKMNISFMSNLLKNHTKRWHVSMLKFELILNTLNHNKHAFMFDLDVFFYDDPLRDIIHLMKTGNKPVVSQTDGPDWNFGCFAVRPSQFSKQVFHNMFEEYKHTQVWDQLLYSRHIQGTVEPLPDDRYVNMMTRLGVHYQKERRVVAAHSTCIEGPELKFFWARKEYGAPIRTSHPSNPQKTTFFNSTLCSNIDEAIVISKRMGSAIRADDDFRCIDPDKIKENYGIRVVPYNYWDTVDLPMNEQSFLLTPSTLPSTLRCKFENGLSCLQICSGKHF